MPCYFSDLSCGRLAHSMVSTSLFLLVLVAFALHLQALDVSFIPNDENAPLPLSAKYRESLAKLCKLLQVNNAKLPPEIMEKRAVLEQMCQKLAKDNANIVSSTQSAVNLKTVAFTLLGIGGGYVLWSNRHWLKNIATGNQVRFEQRAHVGTVAADGPARQFAPVDNTDPQLQQRRILEAREARLQRFANLANAGNQ